MLPILFRNTICAKELKILACLSNWQWGHNRKLLFTSGRKIDGQIAPWQYSFHHTPSSAAHTLLFILLEINPQ